MDRSDIVEVLQTCLLSTHNYDVEKLIKEGFDPELSKIGFKLYLYLQSKKIREEDKDAKLV